MPPIRFTITATDPHTRARCGILSTPHGDVVTPAFCPVATQAAVKALTPDDLREIGVPMLLSNTYHLYLRPGADLIAAFGGLHKFMDWDRPIMTDSGGFQVFSLGFGMEQGVGKIASIFPDEAPEADQPAGDRPPVRPSKAAPGRLVRIDDDGVTFTSHIDGSTHRLTPERSIQVQEQLGADMALAFDECTSPLNDLAYTRAAMERTHRWAVRSLDARTRADQAIFGIVQGGAYRELREQSARVIGALPFEGLAVGGSLGRSKADMHAVLDVTVPLLPPEKPLHLLGIGEPEDLFAGVRRGVDPCDGAAPTRMARNGSLLTRRGRLNIMNARFTDDPRPIEEGCPCFTCRTFSRAYLRHLFRAEELLAPRLATVHNLTMLTRLMDEIREAVRTGTLVEAEAAFLAEYRRGVD
ncbi:MAG: tRNA guanosine(34) transglycosylase Tgt [Chloroflexi bacterium]|nr:tRNA guanosine(34) transglycosylase Tgt [Chloroflexota bacterium]